MATRLLTGDRKDHPLVFYSLSMAIENILVAPWDWLSCLFQRVIRVTELVGERLFRQKLDQACKIIIVPHRTR